MSIYGIGIDIVDLPRLKNILEKSGEKFLKRIFSEKEIDYCFKKKDYVSSLAARIAVKEAFFKAIGLGWGEGMKWKEVEVVNDKRGKPELFLFGKAKKHKDKAGINKLHISVSHTDNYAVAEVITEIV
jgi:holo-[acyl-carrier protein] synthase